MKYIVRICVGLLVFIGSVVHGASDVAAFMENGFTPSLAGTGAISVSRGNDSINANPAGFGIGRSLCVSGTAFQYLEMDYAVVQANWSHDTWGIGLGYISGQVNSVGTEASGVDGRLVNTGENVGYLGQGVLVGAACRVLPNLTVGGTAKSIHESVGGVSASGVGMDLGSILTVMPSIQMGMVIKNIIQPRMEWNTPSKTVEAMDRTYSIGLRTEWLDNEVIVLGNLEFKPSESVGGIGLEYWAHPMLPLWAGINARSWNLGAGLRLSGVGIDFTYSQPSVEGVDSVYRLGLSIKE